ncbi:hypothetical protein Tco_0774759 [Tanacetum coccineum]|uniref:Uncharacterized protein n=1 Tax=Tanacetum coccineum TaxID=301880 RepID=A0ABQ4ZTN6_9ASTR
MDTEEVSDRFVAPCFVNGLEAYDGEINLGVDENMISNEYAVKLCLEHEVKKGNKIVKKELIVVLRGEIYFVKFIINPEEDDVEPGVIFGRSFLRLTKAITDFGAKTVTIYPDIDLILEETKEERKINDDWDHLLDFNIDDVPLLDEEGLPPFVCKMGKSSRNKKRAMENLNYFYEDIGTSSSAGGHLTQEEATKKAIAIRMSQNLEDKVELDGKIVKEYEEAVKSIKGEALKEKDDPGAFIFPIRLEEVNENALADTGSDINTMPFCIYVQLGRDDMKKVDRGITMINHTRAEAMRILINVLYSPIVVWSKIVFLLLIGGIVNTPERLFSTFDGFCHQTFRAARSDVMRNTKSDSNDEEEYQIKRNKFRSPIYGPKPAPYLSLPLKQVNWKPDYKGSYTKEEEATGQWRTEIRLKEHMIIRPNHHDPNAQDMKPWKRYCFHKFTMSFYYEKDVLEMQSLEIDGMLRIRLCEAGSDGEIFTLVAWIRAFNINEPIYAELRHEFYSTYEFDEVCADDELQSKKIIKFRLGRRAYSLTLLEFARTLGLYQAVELEEEGFNVYFEEFANLILRVVHKMITYGLCLRMIGYDKIQKNNLWLLSMFDARHQNRDLDTITLRDLIDSDGKLIPEDLQPGVPRVGILRPPRASLYQGVFEHMAGVYSVPMQGAYNPPGGDGDDRGGDDGGVEVRLLPQQVVVALWRCRVVVVVDGGRRGEDGVDRVNEAYDVSIQLTGSTRMYRT